MAGDFRFVDVMIVGRVEVSFSKGGSCRDTMLECWR